MKAKNPIVWFEIYVDDMKRAQKFYEKILGTQLSELPIPDVIDNDMKMLMFPMQMGAGANGALVKIDGFQVGDNSTIIYFESEDCAIEESRIVEAGGKVFQSKQSIGEYGFMVQAFDTEGNLFGMHSAK